MDLTMFAAIAVAVSLPLVIWDVVVWFRSGGAAATIQPYMQAAYFALFIAGFYLLVSKNILNFSAVLLIATAVTGAIWLWDSLAAKKRATDPRSALTEPGNTSLARERAQGAGASTPPVGVRVPHEPVWLEIAKSFFPVILIVFLVRSFLVEPFKIPSGSMIPTLLVGDFILVNKFTYGIRLPVINKKVVEIHQPQRGEVMVFRYPEDPSIDYIKRIVGVPGDKVSYRNKRLTINDQPVPFEQAGTYQEVEADLSYQKFKLYLENLGNHLHKAIENPDVPSLHLAGVQQFPHKENCSFNEEGFTCTVPPGHYFMMGDNRDNSKDSRYWGFVPEDNIVGKAFLIWWHLGKFQRIGQAIH
jgi:signal peptidase I